MFEVFQSSLALIFLCSCALFFVLDKREDTRFVVRSTAAAQLFVSAVAVFFHPPLAMFLIMLIELFLALAIRSKHFKYKNEYIILILLSSSISLIAAIDYQYLQGRMFWSGDNPTVYFAINCVLTVLQLFLLGAASIGKRQRHYSDRFGDNRVPLSNDYYRPVHYEKRR